MAKLSSTKESPTQTVLVYGPPKTGKTELVGNLSSAYNLIWFDLEKGSATLRKLPLTQQDKINLISIPDSKSFPIGIETMLKVIRGGPVSICVEHGKVSCPTCRAKSLEFENLELNTLDPTQDVVVVDSITQLTASAIAHITKNEAEDYKMKTDDWGSLSKLMETFFSHVQVAKFNIVCISHETEVEMEDGKVRIVPTAGSRNFSRNTAKYFGHVVYAEVKNKKHGFLSSTTAVPNIITGSRSDVDTGGMSVPSLLPIFQSPTLPTTVPNVSGEGQTNGQKAASSLSALLAKKS